MALRQTFSVATIDELARYNNTHCDVIFVSDNTRTGGNPFRWAGGAMKPNGGTVQRGLNGVWEMMFDGPVNVNWFGALPNGADATKGFQNAVDYAYEKGLPVYVPGKNGPNYYSLAQVNLHDNTVVFGDYRRTIILPAHPKVEKIFNVEGQGFTKGLQTWINLYRLTILNQFTGGPITVGCSAIYLNYCDEVHLNELIIDGFDVNINIENCMSVYGRSLRLRGGIKNNMRINWLKPDAPPYLGSWVYMTECEFNGGVLAHSVTKEKFSVYIENMSSITLDKCVVAGNSGGGIKFAQTYLLPPTRKDMGFVVITNCDIDSNHGTGIRGEYSRNCVIKNNWISSGREQKASGIDLSDCESCSISENQCFYNGADGIVLANCNYMTLANNVCSNNGEGHLIHGTGIRCANSSYNTFTGNVCMAKKYDWPNGNQTNGILSDTNSANNIFTANILVPNTYPLQIERKINSATNNIVANLAKG